MPVSFAPIINLDTRILVIGTMPSIASLEAQEYYAYKHNSFWRIIAQAAQIDRFDSYSHKISTLQKLNLGLWDNLKYCERIGSLDSNIKNEYPNDFENLLNQYDNVQKLLFNGQKSFQFFQKYHKELLKKYQYAILPSTSPANASVPYEQKLKLWHQAIK